VRIDILVEGCSVIQQDCIGYLPELWKRYWISAIKEFLEKILNLTELIKKEINCHN